MLSKQLQPLSRGVLKRFTKLPFLLMGWLLLFGVNQVLAAGITEIVKWNFDASTSDFSTNNSQGIPTASAGTTLTGENFYEGKPNTGKAWAFETWSTGALDLDKYFEFKVDLTCFSKIKLTFDERRSATGIRNFEIHYSTDGSNFNPIPDTTKTVADNEKWRSQKFDLSSIQTNISNQTSVSLRIYGYNAEKTVGTWRIDNVVISGPVALYVDSSATTGSKTGLDWANAFTDLQDALNYSSSCPIDQIWVAQGTYKPTSGTDPTATFQLQNGITVYGGFTPSDNEEIKPKDTRSGAETILSGDLGADNSYHVVTGSGNDSTAVLNGVTISGGNADGGNNGGGVYNDDGSPKLVNVTIKNNSATNGGGMYNENGSNPILTSVTFENNTATNDGGGMYNDSSNPEISDGTFKTNTAVNGGGMYNKDSTPKISSNLNPVTFDNNTASGDGGAMYNNNSSPQINRIFLKGNSAQNGGGIYNTNSSNPYVHHVIFSSNYASGNGGGMYSDGSNSTITQSTFRDNSATTAGGAIYNNNSTWTVNNSILWNDSSEISDNGTGTTTVNNSIVQDGWSTGSNISTEDPLLDANFKLQANSPAIDTGENDYAVDQSASAISVDLDQNERLVKVIATTGDDYVDMGAYEVEFPVVSSMTCKEPSTCDNSGKPFQNDTVQFLVTFSQQVTGVDKDDFQLTATSGSLTVDGTSIASGGTALSSINSSAYSISPDGSFLATTYTVTVMNIEEGSDGKLRLDVIDDDTIRNEYDIALGNTGNNTGDFKTGEKYNIDRKPPTVTVNQDANQTDPTTTLPITFKVIFDEPVTGFNEDDIDLTGTAGGLSGATITVTEINPKDSIADYQVEIDNITDGTVIANIAANKVQDTAGNNNEASTFTDNVVSYDITNSTPTVDITDVSPDPRNTTVDIITIQFSEAITGFDMNDLSLKRDGSSISLTGSQTLTSIDAINWTLDNLAGLTSTHGEYVLTLTAASSGIQNTTSDSLSNDASETWEMFTAIPTAPINLTATALSQTEIKLTWEDKSNDETGFKIERQRPAENFILIHTTNANVTTYNDTGLNCGTEYTYQVKATHNISGDSSGITANATTFACSSPPPPPPPSPPSTVKVSVKFAGNGSGSVQSKPSGIDCASSDEEDCEYRFNTATYVTLTATADSGSEFHSWEGHSNCQKDMFFLTSNISCTAYFDLLPAALIVTRDGAGTVTSSPAGIDCSNDNAQCHYTFDGGTQVTLTATPYLGWEFQEWQEDCDETGQVVIDANKRCQAVFVPAPQSNLTISKVGEGVVTSEPAGIDCGTECSNDYENGIEVTLTPVPEPGWIFEDWRGHCDDDGRVSMQDLYRQCIAIFVEGGDIPAVTPDSPPTTPLPEEEEPTEETLQLLVATTGQGIVTSQPAGIDCGNDCTEEYARDTQAVLTAMPKPNWQFEEWEGDCDKTGQVTLDSEKKCEAIFVPINATPINLTVTKIGEGIVTSQPTGIECGGDCSENFAGNNEITLIATPETAWIFEGWRGHCDDNGLVTIDNAFNMGQCIAIFVEDTESSSNSTSPNNGDNNSESSSDSNDAGITDGTNSDNSSNSNGSSNNGNGSSGNNDEGASSSNDGSASNSETSSGSNEETANDDNSSLSTGGDSNLESLPNIVLPNGETLNNDSASVEILLNALGEIGENVEASAIDKSALLANGQSLVKLTATAKAGFRLIGWSGDCSSTSTVVIATADVADNCQPVFSQMTSNNGQTLPSGQGAGQILFAPSRYRVNEFNQVATIIVKRTQACNGNITVDYASQEQEGSATPNEDYLILRGTLSWANNDCRDKSFTITIQPDPMPEANETIILQLSNASGGATIGHPEKAMVTIIDNGNSTTNLSASNGNTENGNITNRTDTVVPGETSPQQSLTMVLKVGETQKTIIGNGQGILFIKEIPNSAFVLVNALKPFDNGEGELILTGKAVGKTEMIVSDSESSQSLTIYLQVVAGEPVNSNNSSGKAESVNDSSGVKPLDDISSTPDTTSTSDATENGEPLDTTVCNQANALGINAQGQSVNSQACFLGKLSIDEVLQPNHPMLTPQQAQTLRISTLIRISPEHVGKTAEILLVGIHNSLIDEAHYTRKERPWYQWDNKLSSLTRAQFHPQLPEIVNVFIFEGDLSAMPGEFTVFVGYRLLEDNTVIYNGLEPLNFVIGNSASIEPQIASRKTPSNNEPHATSYFQAIVPDDAEDKKVSAQVRIDTRHVGQAADILMVVIQVEKAKSISYTPKGQTWQKWDSQLESLPVVQHYQQLPKILEVPVDLSTLLANADELLVYVGYRLADGVIVFNGLEPIRLVIGSQN